MSVGLIESTPTAVEKVDVNRSFVKMREVFEVAIFDA
jgi:hypothetical protein